MFKVTLAKCAGMDAKVVDLAARDLGFSTGNDPSYLPKFNEANQTIHAAVGRILKRLVVFEKQGIQELKELGFTVSLGKFRDATSNVAFSAKVSEYEDDDYWQPVRVTDDIQGFNGQFTLVWNFRKHLSVGARDRPFFYSTGDSNGSAMTFTQILLAMEMRSHAVSQTDLNRLIESRRRLVQGNL